MPSSDALAPPRARSPQLVRLVLLGALVAGLGGLALPGSPARLTASGAVAPAAIRPPVAVAPVVIPAAAVRPPARATRSRSTTTWARPVGAGINSPYGPRWGSWHPGVDFAAHYGAPIHVVADGTVVGAGYLAGESGYGQIIVVRHKGGVITAYAHTSRMLVHAGQHVRRGETIGLVGATGHVTGPHLHFEVRIGGEKVNPVPWLRRHGVRV
ncbi:MAG TPA: M23 family metallopeptidase [Mycobacteriales bacterium]|nr:M23 family metallopeptidase [Mycobacteriales bacterium]